MKPNNRVKFARLARPTAQELRSFAAVYAERWVFEDGRTAGGEFE